MFEVLSASGRDAAKWQSYIDRLPSEYQDILFTPAYARVQMALGHGPCFAALGNDTIQPFMLKGNEISSFYGGGGPLGDWADRDFINEFYQWKQDHKVTKEYIQLHPFVVDFRLPEITKEAVFVDLKEYGDTLIAMSRNRKRGIKAAIDAGVTVERSYDSEMFGAFYEASMRRLNAQWIPPRTLWGSYQFELGDEHTTMLVARIRGGSPRVMLLLVHGYGRAYAHYLAACDAPEVPGINDALYYEAMKYCHDIGCDTFYLGGGLAANDELFKYKLGFSKKTVPIYVQRREYDANSSAA